MPRAQRREGTVSCCEIKIHRVLRKDWLARAEGDLLIAKVLLPKGAFYEDLCFYAQQAAEKALKAVYVRHGLRFQYTHDLDELITDLKRAGITIPPEVRDAVVLTAYAWKAICPGVSEPVTKEEHREVVTMTERVADWARKEGVEP